MRRPSSESCSRPSNVELPEHAHDFLASLRSERGLSRNTVEAYRRDLAQYQETITDTGDISEASVREHLRRLAARTKLP